MRVLMVNRGMDIYGGAEIVIVKLANYLAEKGVENALLTTRIVPEMEKDLGSTEIILCGDCQKASGLPSRILATAHIGEMIALHRGVHKHARDFELINVHNYPSELASFLCDVPVVWMCNEPELYLSLGILTATGPRIVTRVLWKLDRMVTRRYVTRAVVADEFNAERFQRLYHKDPAIINYGIDFDYFSAGTGAAMAERLGLSDRFIVLHVGMLTPFKNQMASLKVVEELRGKIPDIGLVLAGSDGNAEYARMLREYVQKKNLGKQVLFTGHVDRGTVRDLYHSADVLLHPIGSQGGWLAPFEALCAHTPVVVSPDMTASEIIKKNSIGVVTHDYAGAIQDVHDRPQVHDQIAERGAKYIRENLSWDEYCRKMLELFGEVGE
jgi:glycosyltransferase involved in cell wall biosynthesis